jgi:hypothetical protein
MPTALLAMQPPHVCNAVQDIIYSMLVHVLLALPTVVYAQIVLFAQLAKVASTIIQLIVLAVQAQHQDF